ncbi:hypothetical protein AYO38_08640 [bacterium SCGC AG-212-C10]|nr:hypothetical protein AYO38_08640 [bacterium SCGC AG-212-C10]
MSAPTHYDVLGVARDAPPAALRSAYLAASRAHHPDLSIADDAHDRMKAINHAYAVLRDPVQRAAYDRRLPRAKEQHPQSTARRPQPHQPAQKPNSRGSMSFGQGERVDAVNDWARRNPPRPAPARTYTGDASRDWYGYLGIRASATRDEVLAAIRRKKDEIFGAPVTATAFAAQRKELQDATGALVDPAARAGYDAARTKYRQGASTRRS